MEEKRDLTKYTEYVPSDEMIAQCGKEGYNYFDDWYRETHKEGLIPLMNFMGNEIIQAFPNTDFLYAYCLENNITWLQLLGVNEEDISKPGVIY